MSRHSAFNNYDYDNELDEYDGYDNTGEEELSPEDRESMVLGTSAVREALAAESSKVTTAQIQEALWHYYYDVDKSVAYLVSKYISPPADSKKAKKATNSHEADHQVCAAEVCSMEGSRDLAWSGGYGTVSAAIRQSTFRPPVSTWFDDMPWLNVPDHRRAEFIAPELPRGGLLGGSGAAPKMSKLQALAAARKKKASEKKIEETEASPEQQMGSLSLQSSQTKVSATPRLGALVKQRKEASSVTPDRCQPQSATEAQPEIPTVDGAADEMDTRTASNDVAEPSAFARTILGPRSNLESSHKQRQSFGLHYLDMDPSISDIFSRPSPDDRVMAAQAQAGKPKATAKKGKSDKIDSLSNSVQSLKVEDVAPLPKSKNLNVLGEYEKSVKKKNASFVVVGHVDAGKSTMMGRLLLDMNVVDDRTISKYKKEAEAMGKGSFALAWVLDSTSDERAHGVTIDIAKSRFETESTIFTILDAPGHQDFVPNMIAGASQADFAILVIDATVGAYERGLKGQTKEHAQLIRSIGVSRIIVAVNKLDATNWSQDRFNEISDGMSGFMSALGFQMKNISFIPLSGLNGDNLVKRSTAEAASWYTGPTLLEELQNSEPMTRALKEPLRITVSDIYNIGQSTLTVGGRLDAGSVQMGDALLVQPSGEKAYVKSIEVDSEDVDWAVAGQNVLLQLSHIDPERVRAGDVICDPSNPIQCIDSFTVKVLAFDHLWPMPLQVHRGRLDAVGTLQSMLAVLDNATGTVVKKKPKIVKPGMTARVVVKMTGTKVPLEAGQRIILRCDGRTLAAGIIE
ncbi:hypothetical protein PpBr36_07096 [Pyricularia pennisetigena]|uniref:hypothetical protein n=1 Tax=Pyricularia pennisetigena TaxID=1578925 RepID=UPI001152C3B7|nr:hypothetical protein PpBr36_07096 [Pyricularia pennisetigena]TLS25269.1 hypothetical protein PpBr36_07096 [Pyricularia pennisetigena]